LENPNILRCREIMQRSAGDRIAALNSSRGTLL
jgi:hypothetical protein